MSAEPTAGLPVDVWHNLNARKANCGCCLIVDTVALRETPTAAENIR